LVAGKEDASFSEEKEAKRLLWGWRGPARAPGCDGGRERAKRRPLKKVFFTLSA
jgi:hypothetical protein